MLCLLFFLQLSVSSLSISSTAVQKHGILGTSPNDVKSKLKNFFHRPSDHSHGQPQNCVSQVVAAKRVARPPVHFIMVWRKKRNIFFIWEHQLSPFVFSFPKLETPTIEKNRDWNDQSFEFERWFNFNINQFAYVIKRPVNIVDHLFVRTRSG